jgi:hypothetical protein
MPANRNIVTGERLPTGMGSWEIEESHQLRHGYLNPGFHHLKDMSSYVSSR